MQKKVEKPFLHLIYYSSFFPLANYKKSCIISLYAGVMELVDVADSKSADGDIVGVRVPPPAPDNDNPNPVPIGDGFGFLVYL